MDEVKTDAAADGAETPYQRASRLKHEVAAAAARVSDATNSFESLKRELDAALGSIRNGVLWAPQFGDYAYLLCANGTVTEFRFATNGFHMGIVIDANAIGNIFPSRELALREVERRELTMELRRFAADRNMGWTRGPGERSFEVVNDLGTWRHGALSDLRYPMAIHFRNKDDAIDAIKHFGDRLNLLLEDA